LSNAGFLLYTDALRVKTFASVQMHAGIQIMADHFFLICLLYFAGGIENAIHQTINYLSENNKKLKIEIEVRNPKELRQVLAVGGVNRIMLDNFTPEETREAVDMINGQYEIESSGGITLESIYDYATTGVDYISVGALTHHIQSLDISLNALV